MPELSFVYMLLHIQLKFSVKLYLFHTVSSMYVTDKLVLLHVA
jgi:hypothetical protein